MNSNLAIAHWLAFLGLVFALSAPAAAQDANPPAGGAIPAASPNPAQKAAAARGGTAQQEAGDPRVDTSSDAAPTTVPPAKSVAAGKIGGAAKAAKGSKNAADRVDLDTTTITGNRELPKVLYIVPWKRSDIGDLTGRPVNSLLDEVLAPVDRDVFRREVVYYQALKPDAGSPGQAAAPAAPSH